MQIIETELFTKQRDSIVFYIAQDKKTASEKFMARLKLAIENLINFPYKYRKSFYFNDENIRDMIFEGYSIIYRVDTDKNIIEILEIFNQNLPEIK